MKRLALVVAGFLVGAIVVLQVPSSAQQTDGSATSTDRTITVTGVATIHAKPDEAVVSLGVRTQAGNAQDAMAQNAAKMSDVLAALKAQGLGDADLGTTNVSLDPVWNNDGTSVIGFAAQNQVEATIHDLTKVGKVIDAAVGAGANLAGGIVFRLSDQNQGVGDALAQAVKVARGKADAMAAAGDATVGEVVTIAETTASGGPIPYERSAYAVAGDAASTPVNTPTIETQVQVTVTWRLV